MTSTVRVVSGSGNAIQPTCQLDAYDFDVRNSRSYTESAARCPRLSARLEPNRLRSRVIEGNLQMRRHIINAAKKLPRSAEEPLQVSKFNVTQQGRPEREGETIRRQAPRMKTNGRRDNVRTSYHNRELFSSIISFDRQADPCNGLPKTSAHTTLADLLPIEEGPGDQQSVRGDTESWSFKKKLSRSYQSKELMMGSPPESSPAGSHIVLRSRRNPPCSPHELHYKRQQEKAEKLRKKTFLPYKENLLACVGFFPRSP